MGGGIVLENVSLLHDESEHQVVVLEPVKVWMERKARMWVSEGPGSLAVCPEIWNSGCTR